MQLHIALSAEAEGERKMLEREIRACLGSRLEHACSVTAFPSAEALSAGFQADAYSLAFLELRPDAPGGLRTVRRLRDADPRLLIILLADTPEYAFEAFSAHPFDYLLRPFDRRDLRRVLEDALRVLPAADKTIAVRISRETVDIPIRRLSAAIARGHNVELHLAGHETLYTTMTFSEIQGKLAGEARFLLCNRGILINMDHALTMTQELVTMEDGACFPLRSRNRAALRAAFLRHTLAGVERGK